MPISYVSSLAGAMGRMSLSGSTWLIPALPRSLRTSLGIWMAFPLRQLEA